LDLACGGHLTHGHPLNFSGFLYNVVGYGVRKDTETIDYDEVAEVADKHKPKLIVAGASAYPRILHFDKFREIADACGAKLMVDIAHIAGLIVAGLHPTPVPFADFVTSTTHKTLRGPRGGFIMCKEEYAADLDRMVMPGIQGGPLMHVIAAKAVAFKEAATEEFKAYQKQIVANAAAMAKNFVDHGYHVVSGGTDTHLMLLSFIERDFSGRKVERALDKANITVNKNTVPFDTRKPLVTSGIRIGTPAVTTRGMKEPEMAAIAGFIHEVIANLGDEETYTRVAERVLELCRRFPLYGARLENNPT
jgi:glycine hydroxymethyltransferase